MSVGGQHACAIVGVSRTQGHPLGFVLPSPLINGFWMVNSGHWALQHRLHLPSHFTPPFKKLNLCIYLVWVHLCQSACAEVRGQLLGVCSLLSLWAPGANPDDRLSWQMVCPLSTLLAHCLCFTVLTTRELPSLLTILETTLKRLFHEVNGCIPLLLIWYGPVFQSIVLNNPLKWLGQKNEFMFHMPVIHKYQTQQITA